METPWWNLESFRKHYHFMKTSWISCHLRWDLLTDPIFCLTSYFNYKINSRLFSSICFFFFSFIKGGSHANGSVLEEMSRFPRILMLYISIIISKLWSIGTSKYMSNPCRVPVLCTVLVHIKYAKTGTELFFLVFVVSQRYLVMRKPYCNQNNISLYIEMNLASLDFFL